MRRCLAIGLILSLLLTGCAQPGKKGQYQAAYLDVFDTVTSITAQAESEDAFREQAEKIHDRLLRCHQLFDIYNDYAGLNNLKTVNDHAGIGPVKVDGEMIRLLKDCLENPFSRVYAECLFYDKRNSHKHFHNGIDNRTFVFYPLDNSGGNFIRQHRYT